MPIINIVSAVQVTEAFKLITGRLEDLHGSLMQFDVWRNEWRRIGTGTRRADCPTCALALYETLSSASEGAAVHRVDPLKLGLFQPVNDMTDWKLVRENSGRAIQVEHRT